MIDQELNEIRKLWRRSDNSSIWQAIDHIRTALEKLAARSNIPADGRWLDPDGDEWTFDPDARVLRWEHGARRIVDGQIEALCNGKWRPGFDGEDMTTFYRRMWAHFTGEQT